MFLRFLNATQAKLPPILSLVEKYKDIFERNKRCTKNSGFPGLVMSDIIAAKKSLLNGSKITICVRNAFTISRLCG